MHMSSASLREGGDPRAYLGKCGDFDINTSPCSGGNVGKYRYMVCTPGGNLGTLYLETFMRQWRLSGDDNVFQLA